MWSMMASMSTFVGSSFKYLVSFEGTEEFGNIVQLEMRERVFFPLIFSLTLVLLDHLLLMEAYRKVLVALICSCRLQEINLYVHLVIMWTGDQSSAQE